MNDAYVPKEVQSLIGLVDTYKRDDHFSQKGLRSYNHYHPSEMGKCLRTQQYKHYAQLGYIDVEFKELESKILRLFDKGHNMHERWSRYFTEIGILRGRWKCKNAGCLLFDKKGNMKKNVAQQEKKDIIKYNKTRIYGMDHTLGDFRPEKCECGFNSFEYIETPVVDKEINMKGQADLILDCTDFDINKFSVRTTFDPKFLPSANQKIVADMKSIGSGQWKRQLEAKGPHKPYIIQLMIYIYILGCDYGLLIYENKDNSEMKWYKVEKNDSWWETINKQAKMMIDMAASKKLPPPRPLTKTVWECQGCDFKNLCHKSVIWKDENLESKRKNFYGELL
jgi:hypothetical protein